MKRIYLLMVLFVAFAANSYAQADLVLTHDVTTGKHFTGGDGKSDTIAYTLKNLGPNSLTVSDSIVIRTPVGTYVLSLPAASSSWPGGLPKDSTVYWTNVIGLGAPAGVTTSQNNIAFNWCDSMWAKSPTAIIADPVVSNNKVCNSTTITYWATNINDIAMSHEMSVYPNPATDHLTIKYNFGNNASASVIIRDIIGKAVYTKDLGKNLSGEKEIKLDVSSLSAGVYFVELSANNTKIVNKVNIQ
jgi:hypothetical protein